MGNDTAPGGARIRPARPAELAQLSALTVRSKAHWGYDAAFMAAVRDDLTLSPDYLDRTQAFVLEQGGRILGYYGLRDHPDEAELADLFLDPAAIGRGYGRRLWQHAVATARSRGHRHMRFESDPHAEGFYLAMGARRYGERESALIPGRKLPLMRVTFEE